MTDGEIREIELEALPAEALKLKNSGYRLIQMCVNRRIGQDFQLTYSFGIGLDCVHLRMLVHPEDEVMSISAIYEPAFLYENEMQDLFGIRISMISLDYHGKLYRLDKKTPYRPSEEKES